VNRDIGGLLRPLVALALFAIVAAQTFGALRASGAWSGTGDGRGGRRFAAAPADPVASVEALIAHTDPAPAGPARDPFQIGAAPAPVVRVGPVVRKPVTPPPPVSPVLTAIVYDADPRALVRWKGHDWTVRPGGLFDEFQVISITRDQVTLSRGSETIVLQRKPQGD
jgi:hypothetical protein